MKRCTYFFCNNRSNSTSDMSSSIQRKFYYATNDWGRNLNYFYYIIGIIIPSYIEINIFSIEKNLVEYH